MGGGGKGGAARAAASTILARSSSRNSLKSILPLPVLSTLMIIRFTCARQERTVRPAVAPGAAGGRHLLFPRLKAERAQHNLQRVRVYHACARASMQQRVVAASWGGAVEQGRTLPFAVEEVECLPNLGALVLGEREQRGGLLGLRSHARGSQRRVGETFMNNRTTWRKIGPLAVPSSSSSAHTSSSPASPASS